MKYIITEDQQERFRQYILKLLQNEFNNYKVICEIKVYNVDPEEEDYEKGLRYDIHVYINSNYSKVGGLYGFVVATKKKIHKVLSQWIGLNENQYYISVSSKDC